MPVLAASICTRGGKAVLSRQFRDIPRSRIEALLASFPKLANTGTQHTTVEQDNVRFVYQPLDELYIVLITNKQSNILQDIDSLHLFVQVVTNMCNSFDEREILRNAYELLTAFDELVTLGYRENLSINQIKTILEMESHEERIQEIITRNKEIEANEERKRKAKQLEMQRREAARHASRGHTVPPTFQTYNSLPSRPAPQETINSYENERLKAQKKPAPFKGKGMQLSKKTKPSDIMDLGTEVDETPLVTSQSASTPAAASTPVAEPRASLSSGQEPVHVVVSETISAKISREGVVESVNISGDLNLRITDPSLTKIKLALQADNTHGAQFRTHPNVDRNLFNSSKIIQMSNTARGFPINNQVGVLRWRAAPKAGDSQSSPINFTVWTTQNGASYTVTVEYEATGSDELRDVRVSIPYQQGEPMVASSDAEYELDGGQLHWTIGTVNEGDLGSLDFEAETSNEGDFFPMNVFFQKTQPFVKVDVTSVSLLELNEEVSFTKDVKSSADNFVIE